MVPSPLAVDYYGQRASAGLIITEATQVSQQGQGYQDTPGIYSKEQVAGWRKVTDRVHARGGRIFLQIWHVGRISQLAAAGRRKPVAPSRDPRQGQDLRRADSFVDISEPRALELAEIPGIIDDFKRGTENAMAAGFDGVEIHGANGYLLDQFAKDGTNKRTDAYGGSIENRAADAGGVRGGRRRGRSRSHRHPHLAGDARQRRLRLRPAGAVRPHRRSARRAELAYIHVIEGATGGPRDVAPFDYGALRKRFSGAYIANNGYDFDLANEAARRPMLPTSSRSASPSSPTPTSSSA